MKSIERRPVLVIGAGIMGAGIAQVAAQAGHDVMLHDAREGAAAAAKARLASTLDGLAARAKLTAEAAAATLERIRPLASLDQAGGATLVVEAIVEDLEAKRALLRELEAIVGDDCILATNTSSISVTALANGLRRPQRLVGMHFFNPVPLMKLVEVVSGLHTDPAIAQAVFELGALWGKAPVHARSTPGFIVNRIARPFYAEALALLAERAAEPAVLDACLRAAGFRMGPCELMDLIGHDTNFAVTQSVYDANFFDKRYVPSLVQRELVDGGLLGRKSGRGFYDHRDGAVRPSLPGFEPITPPAAGRVVLHGRSAVGDRLADALAAVGRDAQREPQSAWTGVEADALQLRLTDGRCATALGERVAVFDRLPNLPDAGAPLAFAVSQRAPHGTQAQAASWLRAAGFNPMPLRDVPGLLVARTIAMLINEASDAVHQGVCDAAGADAAMKLGVNYPAGPFEWLAQWDAAPVVQLLDALDAHYRGERYRASPALRLNAFGTV